MNPRERRRRAAIKALTVPRAAQLPVLQGTNGGASAQSDGTSIFVQGHPSDQELAHEAAHVLDAQTMGDRDRQRFARILGQPDGQWEKVETLADGSRVAGHSSVEERFADMTSLIALKRLPQPGRGGGFGYLDDDPPSLREILRFGRALERFGVRHGLPTYDRKAVRREALRRLTG